MSRSSLRRLATLATATAAVAVVAAPPVTAAERYFSKSSSTIVSTSWVEQGALPGVAGNAHIGFMDVEDLGRGRARIFGVVFDLTCAPGQVPTLPGGGHGEEPGEEENACTLEGERFLEGGTVTFTVDRKFTKATLTGELAVSAGHGGSTAAPPVNITWTGVGSLYTSRESGTFTDEFGTGTFRYTFSGRDAVVAAGSSIGAMGFDDEPGESSEAQMGTQRSSSRFRG